MTKVVFLAALLVLSAGCLEGKPVSDTSPQSPATPEELCMQKCSETLAAQIDLSVGPCLSNQITADWVCDVAHNPRIEADNQPENQCEAFREGEAHHFVELDTECNLIKKH